MRLPVPIYRQNTTLPSPGIKPTSELNIRLEGTSKKMKKALSSEYKHFTKILKQSIFK